MKFYKCNTCGNVITKMVDSGVNVVCCGAEMTELKPGSVDAATEKHVPAVTVDGDVIKVKVGEVEHPMLDEHYIQFVVLETKNGSMTHTFTPGEKPECEFVLPSGDKAVAVYEYCNLHGLWVKEL